MKWNDEEIKILTECYKTKQKNEVLLLLPNRTWIAITEKANSLGIKKTEAIRGKNHHSWKGGKITEHCKICKKPFKIFPSRKGHYKYCSKECRIKGVSKITSEKMTGENNPNWLGGRYKNNRGYWIRTLSSLTDEERELARYMTFDSKKFVVLEHRMLMAKKIGRPLYKNEVVHHINGIKADNRLENLQLLIIGTHSMGNLFNGNNVCPNCGYEW